MNAANFTTFSTGIGTTGFVRSNKFIHDHPKEYYRAQGMGMMDQLPVNKANPKEDKPAYVTDVKFAMSAGIIFGTMIPKAGEMDSTDPQYKHKMYHICHPTRRFLEECIQSWDEYQTKWKDEGWNHDYIPYPYTYEMIDEYFQDYSGHVGFPCSIEGPGENAPLAVVNADEIVKLPDWATDASSVNGVQQQVKEGSEQYWCSQS